MKSSAFTEPGLVRAVNQDAVLVQQDGERLLAVLADGMGGHNHGELASQLMAENLSHWWAQATPSPPVFSEATEQIRETITNTNRKLWEEHGAKGRICGTTVVVLYIDGPRYVIVNVGDSRAYSLRGGLLVQLSQDHTVGTLQAGYVRGDPQSDKLTQAVGGAMAIRPFVRSEPLEAGTVLLLCSDGVYTYYTDAALCRWLKRIHTSSAEELFHKMKQTICAQGAQDNFSAILIRVNG